MEHRWGQRLSTELEINVRIGPNDNVRCRVENVSSGGLFARLPGVDLAVNSIVEVEFKDAGHIPFSERTMTAMVAHTSAEGMGLTFETIEEGIWQWLKDRTKAPSNTG